MIKFIKYIIFFYVAFSNTVLFSSYGIDKFYRELICLPRKKNNFLLTVGAVSSFLALYYLASKTNKKILQGESFTGFLQRCNVYKDKIFLVDEWIKNLIVPGGIYLTLGRCLHEKNNIARREHRISKLMVKSDGQLICNKNTINIKNYNIYKPFEDSKWALFIEEKGFLHSIYHPIRDNIGIYFYIAYKEGNRGEIDTDYYTKIENIENRIENFDKKQSQSELNLEDVRDIYMLGQKYSFLKLFQVICNKTNEKLKENFEKKKIIFALLTVGLVSFCVYLGYRSFLAKKYIEKNGLGHGDILTRFCSDYQLFLLNKVICANVDWLYWSLGVIQYLILPGASLISCNIYLKYKNNNNLAYNLNSIFGLKHQFFQIYYDIGVSENVTKHDKDVIDNLLKSTEYKEEFGPPMSKNYSELNNNDYFKIKNFHDKMSSNKSLEELCSMLYYHT